MKWSSGMDVHMYQRSSFALQDGTRGAPSDVLFGWTVVEKVGNDCGLLCCVGFVSVFLPPHFFLCLRTARHVLGCLVCLLACLAAFQTLFLRFGDGRAFGRGIDFLFCRMTLRWWWLGCFPFPHGLHGGNRPVFGHTGRPGPRLLRVFRMTLWLKE